MYIYIKCVRVAKIIRDKLYIRSAKEELIIPTYVSLARIALDPNHHAVAKEEVIRMYRKKPVIDAPYPNRMRRQPQRQARQALTPGAADGTSANSLSASRLMPVIESLSSRLRSDESQPPQ
jgi:hypothetical protein